MEVEFLVVQGQPRGKSLHFPPGDFVVGRGPECHIRPNTAYVNRQHCLLRVTRDGALLRDLGSSTGTLVNGRLVVGERLLNVGDRVQLGPVVLEMRKRGEPQG
jgi:S-DNA-T family DNA segregation ATPase FtsK/SpoIIIE